MSIRLFRYPSDLPDLGSSKDGGLVATIGSFDGIHLGHTHLINEVVRQKKQAGENYKSALISFYPHPAVKLGKTDKLPALTDIRKRMEILREYELDYLYLIHFTDKFSKLSAADFIEKILINKLHLKILCVGPDARLGRGAEGNVSNLEPLLKTFGARLNVIPLISLNECRASSRKIREIISEGDITEANALLGRRYSINGRVIRGDRRGNLFNFPTANLAGLREQLLPNDGVYASYSRIDGMIYKSVTNIGTRPTFGKNGRTVETFLIDYQGSDFYGARFMIEFHKKIRNEIKFKSTDDLVNQIKLDVEKAKILLNHQES